MPETPRRHDQGAFLALHRPGRPLLAPNPWDIGSAKLFASLGFEALATTSSGFAATLGRLDGNVSRDEALAHGQALAAATPLPVTADLEDGYAADEAGVAETVTLARGTGLAGVSIEDWDGERLRSPDDAAARVAAAVEAAGQALVVTGRAENHIHGVDDLDDTIARLVAYEAAGAHVLYAPGLVDLGEIRTVVEALSAPVNVLLRPAGPTVAELAQAGVARITVGGALAFAGLGAVAELARELLESGTAAYGRLSAVGSQAATAAFGDG